MGKRGRHRDGFYLVVLYALELQYMLQAQFEPEPLRWEPLPRNRPDQFLSWILDSLQLLGQPPPETLGALLAQIEALSLPHTARMLEAVLTRRLVKAPGLQVSEVVLGLHDLSPAYVLGMFGVGAAEAHPQARKMAQFLTRHLDSRWCVALEQTALRTTQALPEGVVLLGSLPPGFDRLQTQLLETLDSATGESPLADLTVLQFYALITGDMPRPAEALRAAMQLLEALKPNEWQLLKSLSAAQLDELCALSRETLRLLTMLREVRLKLNDVGSLLPAVASLTQETLEEVLYFLMLKRNRPGGSPTVNPADSQEVALLKLHWPASPERLRAVFEGVQAGAWQAYLKLDRGLVTLFERNELTPVLGYELQMSERAVLQQAHTLLVERWDWTTTYLEDTRVIAELLSSRSPAQLNLRQLFPASIAWLDDLPFEVRNDAAATSEHVAEAYRDKFLVGCGS